MRNLLCSGIAIAVLTLIAYLVSQSGPLTYVLTVIAPYVVLAVFLVGFLWRIVKWGCAPVPFRITTTCGQQQSLPWIKSNPLENPPCRWGAAARMVMEILFFRSLFRNARMEMVQGRPGYVSAKWLWLFAMFFHWSLLVILIRHLRFLIEPVPGLVNALAALDGFFEITLPTLYLSTLLTLVGLGFLLGRRLIAPRVRYISNFSDYFSLFLLLAVVLSGILMRHFFPVDLLAVKSLARGWVTFTPVMPEGLSPLFYLHIFYVWVLLIWFPASKLMHAGGVFLSPTRNLANDSRTRRHVNPWNEPVKVHTYEEYENEFRQQMKDAGLPVEKE
jgi:nitrate reductase gamma subunit